MATRAAASRCSICHRRGASVRCLEAGCSFGLMCECCHSDWHSVCQHRVERLPLPQPRRRYDLWLTERLAEVKQFSDFRQFSDSELIESIQACCGQAFDAMALLTHLRCRCRKCSSPMPRHKLVGMAMCECELCSSCYCGFLSGLPDQLGCPACGVAFSAEPVAVNLTQILVREMQCDIGEEEALMLLKMLDDWARSPVSSASSCESLHVASSQCFSAQPLSQEWQCKYCNFKNASLVAATAMICDIDILTKISFFPNDQEWSCSVCTLLNPNSRNKCTMCESDRPIFNYANRTPAKAKPVMAHMLSPKVQAAANQQLIQMLKDLETAGTDGRLAQLYLVTSHDEEAPSEVRFHAWEKNKWPALIEQIGRDVARALQEIHPGVATVATRPSFDDLAASVLENPCDLETAIQVCAQRHVEKVAWIAKHCPELLQSVEVDIDLRNDLSKVFKIANERVFKDFAENFFSEKDAKALEVPNFRRMNGSEAALHCLMGEFELRKFSDAETLFQLLREKEFENYNVEDLAEAAKNCGESCDYIDLARKYLKCECSVCFTEFPKHKLLPMASCQCELCLECFYNFVTDNARSNMHVTDLHCRMCETPNANQVEELESHFGLLLLQIKNFRHPVLRFEKADVDLIENKIAEWNLIRDPNFRWCSQCGNGLFLGDIMLGLKFQCPDCLAYTCKDCRKPWEDQHEGLDCDQFEQWQKDNDPEYQEKGIGFFLQANGIQCPNCRFQYALAKGGCLHFICRQCRFQFCAGCNGQFKIIQGRGLRCKHPRDCLFYLRDFGVTRLQQLLNAHKVEFETDIQPAVEQCEVMEQKEKEGKGLADEPCGVKVNPGHANLCEKHYIEYLVSLVNKHKLDPVSVMEEGELRGVCGRHDIDCSGVGEKNLAALQALIIGKVPLNVGN